MIAEVCGRLVAVREQTVLVQCGALTYEVLVPGQALGVLQGAVEQEVRLHTVFLLDGNLATGSLVPRLVGFLAPADRALFGLLTGLRGVSTRKALRAMQPPTVQIAGAIRSGDVKLLSALPEIGPRTAKAMVEELREAVAPLLDADVAPAAAETPLTDVQEVALEILVQWGDRRVDAQRWIAGAVAADPTLATPEEIVRAAYRFRSRE